MTWILDQYVDFQDCPLIADSRSTPKSDSIGGNVDRSHPLMTVYTAHGGQRKGSKHVINFPQNLSWFATTLPQKPEHIPLIVRRSNLNDDKHYDFRVRRRKVRRALQWLKQNHKWYRDIMISEDLLNDLPIDDNLEHLFVRRVDEVPLPSMPQPVGESTTTSTEDNVDSGPSDEDMGMIVNLTM
jgi:hypothetical protein